MDPATPVVVSKSVARKGFERWAGSLRALPQGIAITGYEEPVLIGIGSVFAAVASRRFATEPRAISMGGQ
ncbi:hypothetical protein [Hoeflea sp.]|uniref:hypothetical protein n=1 Tax=Hoeflea sp. TaxID=1940281 RepID=UPI003747E915